MWYILLQFDFLFLFSLVDMAVFGLQLDFMILQVFFQPKLSYDSVSLQLITYLEVLILCSIPVAFTWFFCNNNFSDYLDLISFVFVCYDYSFTHTAVTSSCSRQNEIFMTNTEV